MQTATEKTKSNKSRKAKKNKSKKSKPIKSTAKKASSEITDAEKLLDQEDTTPDPNAATNSIDPKESNKESDTVEGSNREESKQEQPSVEEILTEVINTNKITGDAHAEQDSEDTADPNEAAAEQTKVEESHIRQADVSSDQENIVQDPNAANDSTDSEESNEKPAIVEESKQEQPSVEETFVETSGAEEIAEDAQTEQVPEGTADSENDAAEQNNAEESQLRESDGSSDQEDTAPDPNAVNDVAEDTAAAPETGEETVIGKIFEAIQKMTQSPADLPGQPVTEEKSTPGITSSPLEISATEIMQNQITWASPDDSLQQAFAKMQQTDAGYIMIGLNEALEGIVSKSDITKAMSPYLLPIFAKWRRPLDDATLKIRIKWIMSRPVHTIKPETSLATIMEHMSQFRGRCLPVMDEEGNVQGLVTAFDIFQALLKSNSNTCSTDEAPQELVNQASSTETT